MKDHDRGNEVQLNRLTELSTAELAQVIRGQAGPPVVMVEAHRRRIEHLNPSMNAIVTIAPDLKNRAREITSRSHCRVGEPCSDGLNVRWSKLLILLEAPPRLCRDSVSKWFHSRQNQKHCDSGRCCKSLRLKRILVAGGDSNSRPWGYEEQRSRCPKST